MKISTGQGIIAGLVAAIAAIVITRAYVDREAQGWLVHELVWLTVFIAFWFATAIIYWRIAGKHNSDLNNPQI